MTYSAQRIAFMDERPDLNTRWVAPLDRFKRYAYHRVGNSGLVVSPIGLGTWYNFGDDTPFQQQRDIIRFAFEHGINHFDLANQYGPPLGAAEENVGRVLRKDFGAYRHELVITTKAGWPQWLGPNGRLGGKKHLLGSIDESLTRLGLDHVDIFYSHRYDPDTPLRETIEALDTIVRQGKALYVGISSYSAQRSHEAFTIAQELGTPLLVNQSSYSLLNRWIEDHLLDDLAGFGGAAVAFTPLAQGLLAERYLQGFDNVKRSQHRPYISSEAQSADNLNRLRGLAAIAAERGQTLSQLAIAWTLRDPRVASTLVGVSNKEQLAENLKALENLTFTEEELQRIDRFAVHDGGVNPWKISSEL
ncbi:Putative aldo/keto reductase [Sodalis praecaptivus]|uniref:Putative aldo/keto reductase n=1 Tax=Sodalis praecaptivus TaxID=1239307 RepID=W0HXL1_9GAMM|nr:aldo/keto reductase [Sodalis praecaptivus]AHF77262.1 Putative aldo/keto reductase [Sodalis praecaptivus]